MTLDYSTVLYSLPGMLILTAIESIEMLHDHRFGEGKKGMLSSLFIGIIAIAIAATTKSMNLLCYSWVYQYRLMTIPAMIWWAWVVCFIADDFSFYWFHRCSHQVRFFWASHIVHHSPQTFTLTTAFRLPWTSHVTGNFLFWIWMPLLGLSPAMIITMKAVSTLYQLWLHTEKIRKLSRWFEAVFNTPSHHRVHHGTEVEHLDKNCGGTLIIWDRLFGTFCPETYTPVYGLTKNIDSNNPFVIEFSEWGNMIKDLRKARSLRDCMNFIFNSPGWSNDVNNKTTKALRRLQTQNKRSTPAYSENNIRNNSAINYSHFLILFVMLFFVSQQAIAQDKLLSYNVMHSGSKIGSLTMSRHDSLSMSFIKTSCEVKKRFIILYTVTERQEAFFEKGMLVSSYVYRKVNSHVKVDQYTQFAQNFYTIRKGKEVRNILIKSIYNNQASLYFNEPVNTHQIYSDFYTAFLDIEKVSVGVYKLILPDGNVNYYYYSNGVCNKVHIERTLFTVEFVLVKNQGQ